MADGGSRRKRDLGFLVLGLGLLLSYRIPEYQVLVVNKDPYNVKS